MSSSSSQNEGVHAPLMENNTHLIYKRNIALMGFAAVGKTSISRYFKTKEFEQPYSPTPSQTWDKETCIDKVKFDIHIVDTAGMDDQMPIPKEVSIGMDGYVLVFAVNSRQSFDIVCKLQQRLTSLYMAVPYILVGNKIDLEDEREVFKEDIIPVVRSWKCPYVECSAKLGKNIDGVFHTLIHHIDESSDIFDTTCCCSIF
ncbi:hypothetical protein WA158_008354 [Blastocystis sp. Blastoise]